MKRQLLFLNNDCKKGSSFIVTVTARKVYIATSAGEFEVLDKDLFMDVIRYEVSLKKISFIGVL